MRGCAAMAASAEEGRGPSVARGQERALAGRESPDRPARSIVHAVDRVHWEALEQPLLDHDPAAAEPFLRRLKDEMHLAGEISAFCEIARRP